MIFDLILNVLLIFAGMVTSILPTATLDSNLGSAISTVGSTLYSFDYFFNGAQLLAILALVFTFEIIINGFRIFTWVYTRIRG